MEKIVSLDMKLQLHNKSCTPHNKSGKKKYIHFEEDNKTRMKASYYHVQSKSRRGIGKFLFQRTPLAVT